MAVFGDALSKICVALPSAKVGGSYLFLRYFTEYLQAQGLGVTHDLADDYDLLFFNSWTVPYPALLQAKKAKPHLRLVQRVDGAAQDYGRRDGVDGLQRQANTLADLTIYQSQYSYEATHTRFGLITQDGPIIHNPVKLDHFRPDGPRMTDWPDILRRVILVGWSPNPLKGTWRIPNLAQANPDIEFVVVGRADDLPNFPNIRVVPYLDHAELPTALRSADVYLSLIRNDACPNVILEALACGLPVLYDPSGGVPELVRTAGVAFEDDAAFIDGLTTLYADLRFYQAEARHIVETHHAPTNIYARYLTAMTGLKRRPMPSTSAQMLGLTVYRLYQLREQRRKWGRILRGEQSLRKGG